MIVYLDTSVLLRLVLHEPGALDQLPSFDALVSSELIGVECHRTLDRLRLQGVLTAHEAADAFEIVREWLDAVEIVPLQPAILSRASAPLPTPLGTLDAIHLATALTWRDRLGAIDAVATHDAALALAARAFGFTVIGG